MPHNDNVQYCYYGVFIMGDSVSVSSQELKEVAEKVGDVDKRMYHVERILPQLVETQNKTNEILSELAVKNERDDQTRNTLSRYGKKLDEHEAKISQNEKTIAKWTLICSIAFGLIANYLPELKSVVGL